MAFAQTLEPLDLTPVQGSTEARDQRRMRALASTIAIVLCLGIVGAAVGQSPGDGAVTSITDAQFAALRGAAPPIGLASHKQRITTRAGQAESTIEVVVDEQGRSAGEFALGSGRPISIVTDGDVVFLPSLDRQSWLGFRLTDLEAITSVGGDDPLAFLHRLTDPSQVSIVGSETVRDDVVTTRFQADVPFASLFDLAVEQGTIPADQVAQFEALALDIDPVRMDVWLDDAGMLRQFTLQLSLMGFTTESRVEVYDVGIPVTVTVPDPATVLSIVDSRTADPTGPYVTHLQLLLTLP